MHPGAGAMALAVVLTLAPVACGGDKSADSYAREACQGLTEADARPEADRLDFLREKEQLAEKAANADARWDALYDARRDLRHATKERDSKAALVAGLLVVKECRKLSAG